MESKGQVHEGTALEFIARSHGNPAVRPNPSLKRSANGRPPDRAWRPAVVARLARTLGLTMPVTATPKLEIAAEMLERSIELFLRGDSYHSALHLAGAAEELLGVYARSVELSDGNKVAPSFDQMKRALVEVLAPQTEKEKVKAEKWAYDRLTDPKNSVKHMRGNRDTHFVYDSEQEAEDVIDRAVSTYIQLNLNLSRSQATLIAAFDRLMRGDGEA